MGIILTILFLVAVVVVAKWMIGLKIKLFRWFWGYEDGEEMPFLMKLLLFHWLFGSHGRDGSD